jgi:ABC-type lipoprotein release transport system permease subunit
MEAKMQMLPPQVELDPTVLLLILVTLAIVGLACGLPTHVAGRSKAANALRSRAAGPSRAPSWFGDARRR